MVLGFVVVDLVDGHSGVHDVWLDSLLVDHWLDGLVDVVVDMLTTDLGHGRGGVLRRGTDRLILELSLCLREARLGVLGVTLIMGAVLDWDEVVVVLLGQDLAIVNWLDGGVVVVLVDLAVGSDLTLLSLMGSDGLLPD